MKIVEIKFAIETEELTKLTPEDVENAIKEEILKATVEAVAPMLDDEDFIEMSQSEDKKEFIIKINLMIGSTSKYIDATSQTITNLMKSSLNTNLSDDEYATIINNATKPLIDLVS